MVQAKAGDDVTVNAKITVDAANANAWGLGFYDITTCTDESNVKHPEQKAFLLHNAHDTIPKAKKVGLTTTAGWVNVS